MERAPQGHRTVSGTAGMAKRPPVPLFGTDEGSDSKDGRPPVPLFGDPAPVKLLEPKLKMVPVALRDSKRVTVNARKLRLKTGGGLGLAGIDDAVDDSEYEKHQAIQIVAYRFCTNRLRLMFWSSHQRSAVRERTRTPAIEDPALPWLKRPLRPVVSFTGTMIRRRKSTRASTLCSGRRADETRTLW